MRFKSYHMPIEIFDLLDSKYKLIDSIAFKRFDQDWDVLRDFFRQTKKEKFNPLDRYIIEHQDTDIYLDVMSVGVNFRNFFQIAKELDIPFYTFIIWTNHFGIQKEIDILCRDRHPLDRPILIESFCAYKHVFDVYQEYDQDIDAISHHALSMMGSNRSHRFALYNALRDVSPDKLAMSIQGAKK